MTPRRDIAIIGAGAAGCFCAVQLARRRPDFRITVYEAGAKPLAKVAVTGGGRCNLTNSFAAVTDLAQVYPRGHRLMKRLFHVFNHEDTWRWFEAEGVPLVLQDDQCVFPQSQDAMQIVRVLLERMREAGVTLRTGRRLTRLELRDDRWELTFNEDETLTADAVVITTGGSPKPSGLAFLVSLGLETIPPCPSLFTFKIPQAPRTLMGTVVEEAAVSLAGTRYKADGPLLITDWGMSGPAVLKLSSYAARYLSENGYRATLLVNWLGDASEDEVRERIRTLAAGYPQKQIASIHAPQLTGRLWEFLLTKAGLRPGLRYAELGSKGLNRLVAVLTADPYEIFGKAAFKEEFVTCGGISLSEINPNTLEAKRFPGLYLAGEVLDIDAVTGGFNLQAAWTGGAVIARSLAD
ncbi:MAG: aminoacetone oxidase family FAD-binding enzyme [Bacteroidales bacterium]|nr:aminoacetone oxidase family FAD-binding enzyme [Bacteroidales bacterium]